ncbi:MAG TPA: cytochrome c oxidase accessory protein CcoG [Steroidobacteraceae bacterium]|nr:cytochrome c oxidase accessory protein CcoG [Steroidobacteraceae bacterium]
MNAAPGPATGGAAPPVEPAAYYAKHVKIHPREVEGRFDRLRRIAVFALLGLFYLVPWLNWGGRQAVLFDLPARKFWILGLVLWPQDFIFLTWILVLLGISLFFFTALAGRLWCGFACPQTVWTEVFVWIERLIEGDRARRIKLDRAPWTAPKLARKSAKQSLWIVFSLWTGLSFVGFFVPMRTLAADFATLSVGGWALFWTLFYGAATYVNAGYMREQVCKYMCPYARFQSAMFDRNTLIITYDAARGEPRGARARSTDYRAKGLGDCIDCTLCVQACPTGIDIRQGLQYECIACAACIDACDAVMDRVGYPRGLIRYTTQNALEGRPSPLMRPRTYIYATLLGVIFVAGLAGLLTRKSVALDVIRDRNALYQQSVSGAIENVYTLKILNKDQLPHTYRLAVEGLEGIRLDAGRPAWRVEGGEVYSVPARVAVPDGTVRGGHDIRFVLSDADNPARRVVEKARFIAP